MAFGGMTLVDLDDAARKEHGLAGNAMAMFVKGVGQWGIHGAAKKAGFIKEDIIIGIDAMNARTSEGELIGRLLQTRKAGEFADVTVLRGSERLTLQLPMQ
jgi:S1-C subfamily serine protease